MVLYKHRIVDHIMIIEILVILILQRYIGMNAQQHQIEVIVKAFKQER